MQIRALTMGLSQENVQFTWYVGEAGTSHANENNRSSERLGTLSREREDIGTRLIHISITDTSICIGILHNTIIEPTILAFMIMFPHEDTCKKLVPNHLELSSPLTATLVTLT